MTFDCKIIKLEKGSWCTIGLIDFFICFRYKNTVKLEK